MKSFIIAGTLGMLALLALGLLYGFQTGRKALNAAPPAAVITVLSPGVFASNGTATSSPASGDPIAEGTRISTDATGEAEFLFPSGSIARIDANTTITIREHFFDEASGTSQISVFLTLGRVWSRVAKLATPASHWEVKTSNVVAVVRGTAFNVGFTKDGKSRVLVRENMVHVSAVDSTSGTVLAEADVAEEQFVEIEESRVEKTKRLEVTAPTKEFLDDEWIRKNEERDTKAEGQVRARETELLERAGKFVEELEKDNRSWDDYIEKTRSERILIESINKLIPDSKADEPEKTPEVPLPRTEDASPVLKTPPSSGGATLPRSPKITRIAIIAIPAERAYFEGAKIEFRLSAEYDNGEKGDVTSSATWSAKGPIGSLTGNILNAAITEPTIAEFGKADGSVRASFGGLTAEYPLIILSPETKEVNNDRG